jgi:polar amino acid transport system substrate-binding protein
VHGLARKAAYGVALLLACGAVTGCEESAQDGETTPSPEVVESGALVVCTELPYKPFVYEEDGERSGFELELLERMAAGIGSDLEVRQTPYAVLDSGRALETEECDVAAGALSVTDERRRRMAFLEPHYDVKLTLLVPTASDVDGLDDLAGRRLAVQDDTVAEAYARQNVGPDTIIEELAGDHYMFAALRRGRVDGILQDLPLNLVHARTGRFVAVEEHATGEQYAFAVRRGADRLRRVLNEQLVALRQDGTYDELYDTYFSSQ